MKEKPSPRHILAMNLKYLGDIIVITPALKALRTAFPDSRITYMVRTEYASAAGASPCISDVLPFDFSLRKLSGWHRLAQEYKWIKTIRGLNVDTVIEFHPGDRYTLWAWASGAHTRVGPKKQAFSYLLTDQVDVAEDSVSYLEYYLRIVNALGARTITRDTEFVVSPAAAMKAEAILSAQAVLPHQRLVTIHPGASEPSKVWPAEKFALLIGMLSAFPGVRILLFQGPMETDTVRRIQSRTGNRAIVADTTADVGIMAALMRRSSLCVVHDSSARHLAASQKIPTITLFPEDKLGPWNFYTEDQGQIIIRGKRNLTNSAAPFLDGIGVEEVFGKIASILALSGTTPSISGTPGS